MIRAEEAHRFGGQCARIFDCLRFVENTVIEPLIFELQCVAPQSSVGGQHDIVIREVIAGLKTRCSAVIENAQLGGKRESLLFPMKHQRARHHHERWQIFLSARAFLATRFEQCQRLNRFAQSHVVGETTAKTKPLEKKQPA
jgi:hypothetical protein